ncbi:MAG: enterochelin esterase [Bdellovibrionales bacterium]|nr:enterochelin esterase [Bdellovibrionales bacterium]
MFEHHLEKNLNLFAFSELEIHTLVINSQVLRKNPLKDTARRVNPILVPKKKSREWPVVFVLAGFTGNGGNYFNIKSYEANAVQTLASAIQRKKAPMAIYVFVDAWTYWGGSQFINSRGCGAYEDYIIKELVPAIKKNFSVSSNPALWAVTGGSSGGYGALHLASQFPQHFGVCAAIAPDSFFPMSLLPELYSAWPYLQKWGGVVGVKKAMEQGKILGRRESHTLLNAIGMGLCYAANARGEVEWPFNENGELLTNVWKKWLKKDPLQFLLTRKKSLTKVKHFYLDVGLYDQFHLQYGSRQIYKILKSLSASVSYTEFSGNHFDIGDRRIDMWKWLNGLLSE